jgi:hypothetical protein
VAAECPAAGWAGCTDPPSSVPFSMGRPVRVSRTGRFCFPGSGVCLAWRSTRTRPSTGKSSRPPWGRSWRFPAGWPASPLRSARGLRRERRQGRIPGQERAYVCPLTGPRPHPRYRNLARREGNGGLRSRAQESPPHAASVPANFCRSCDSGEAQPLDRLLDGCARASSEATTFAAAYAVSRGADSILQMTAVMSSVCWGSA